MLSDIWKVLTISEKLTLLQVKVLVTHVGRAFSCVCLFVCLSVCLFVRAVTGKRLELSTPNLVHVYSMAVVWHALTQRSRSHGYEYCYRTRLLVNMAGIPYTYTPLCYLRRLPAWVCMSISLPIFSSFLSDFVTLESNEKFTYCQTWLHMFTYFC